MVLGIADAVPMTHADTGQTRGVQQSIDRFGFKV